MKKLKRRFTLTLIIIITITLCSPVVISADKIPKIKLSIGRQVFTATMHDNETVQAFIELLPMSINMSDYGGFEKVGSLSTSLPRNDQWITTQSGDLILYQGNSLVIFYEPNAYSYTRLGRIDDITGLAAALGKGNIEIDFDTITEKVEGMPLNIKNIVRGINNHQANVEIYNPNDANVIGILLAAIYNGKKLIEFKMLDEITFPGKKNSIAINVDFDSEIKANYIVRIFVWESIRSMQPLSNIKDVKFQEDSLRKNS